MADEPADDADAASANATTNDAAAAYEAVARGSAPLKMCVDMLYNGKISNFITPTVSLTAKHIIILRFPADHIGRDYLNLLYFTWY